MNGQLVAAYTILIGVFAMGWIAFSVVLAEKLFGDDAVRNPFYGLGIVFSPAVIWALYTVVTQS